MCVQLIEAAFAKCESIERITSLNTVPPKFSNTDNFRNSYSFSENVYNNATLYIPKGSKSYYWIDPVWGNFRNIVEIDNASSIEDIRINLQTKEGRIFNINGVQMPNYEIENLPAGIYIINGKKRLINR